MLESMIHHALADPRRGLGRCQRGHGRHRRRDVVGRDGRRRVPRAGRDDDGEALRRRGEARDTFRNAANYRLDDVVRVRRRGHRDGRHVYGQSPQRQSDHRAHGVGVDDALDVSGALGHSDLRVHPPREDAASRHALSRRLPRVVRRLQTGTERMQERTFDVLCSRGRRSRPAISSYSRKATSKESPGGTNTMQILMVPDTPQPDAGAWVPRCAKLWYCPAPAPAARIRSACSRRSQRFCPRTPRIRSP